MRAECEYRDIELPAKGDYATGLVFLPKLPEDRHIMETMYEQQQKESVN